MKLMFTYTYLLVTIVHQDKSKMSNILSYDMSTFWSFRNSKLYLNNYDSRIPLKLALGGVLSCTVFTFNIFELLATPQSV